MPLRDLQCQNARWPETIDQCFATITVRKMAKKTAHFYTFYYINHVGYIGVRPRVMGSRITLIGGVIWRRLT